MGNAKVILGAYVPGSSWLHHLDPRVKLFSCFWYVVIVFLASNWLGYLWLFIVLGTLIALSRLPLKLYWRGIKPLFWIILFTVAIQLLFSSGGHVYWQWGWLAITSGGFYQSAIILARFILIITIGNFFGAVYSDHHHLNRFDRHYANASISGGHGGIYETVALSARAS